MPCLGRKRHILFRRLRPCDGPTARKRLRLAGDGQGEQIVAQTVHQAHHAFVERIIAPECPQASLAGACLRSRIMQKSCGKTSAGNDKGETAIAGLLVDEVFQRRGHVVDGSIIERSVPSVGNQAHDGHEEPLNGLQSGKLNVVGLHRGCDDAEERVQFVELPVGFDADIVFCHALAVEQ